MSVEAPWVKVAQKGLEQLGLKIPQPLALKVALLAYARLQANGHARFQRGELAELTDKRRQDIDRAIRIAVKNGWLHEASCTECLIPPGDFIEMSWGNSRKACSIHPDMRKINRGATETCRSGEHLEALSASNVSTQCLQPVALNASSEAIA
jgi:hypothetical protein